MLFYNDLIQVCSDLYRARVSITHTRPAEIPTVSREQRTSRTAPETPPAGLQRDLLDHPEVDSA